MRPDVWLENETVWLAQEATRKYFFSPSHIAICDGKGAFLRGEIPGRLTQWNQTLPPNALSPRSGIRLLRDLLVKPPRKYDIMCSMKIAIAVIARDIKEVGSDR